MISTAIPPLKETPFRVRDTAEARGVPPVTLTRRPSIEEIEAAEDAADIALAEARLDRLEAGESSTCNLEEVLRELQARRTTATERAASPRP
jgi:hypothetical protein